MGGCAVNRIGVITRFRVKKPKGQGALESSGQHRGVLAHRKKSIKCALTLVFYVQHRGVSTYRELRSAWGNIGV